MTEKLTLSFVETHTAYIGIGSNLGDKRGYCLRALELMDELDGVTVQQRSSLYQSPPLGPPDQDWFVNAVVRVQTSLAPRNLLAALHLIEIQLHRKRNLHWGPRTIDLDLLFYDQEIITEEEIKIPHPELHKRHFVLLPLSEIAPRLVHPNFKKSVRSLLRELPKNHDCLPLKAKPKVKGHYKIKNVISLKF